MIRLRMLGALDLTDANGRELSTLLAQPKRVALLAYLTLATPRGPHRRDRLIALFWPEHDDEHARNSLSQALRFLRRSLGEDMIVSRNDSEIGVAIDRLSCDALDFETAIEGGRLAEALDLYTGDLLDAFHVGDVPAFQQWLETERARLSRLYLATLESAAGDVEARRDYAAAIVHWRRAAARDPLSSRIALRLMRAMAAAGDPGAAVQHARVHIELLREELRVAPDPAITALVRELSSGRASPDPSLQAATGALAPATRASSPPEALPAITRTERKRVRRPSMVMTVGIALLTTLSLTALHVRRQQAEAATYLQELYERGRFAENSRSYLGLQKAKGVYTMAIERDPEYALGYAGLAGVYGFMADYAFAPVGPALDTARMMAMRGIQYGAYLSDVHMARAVTLGDAHEFDVAEREFQRAIELDETNGRAHYWYGVLLVALGRGAEALEQIRLAEKHDPFPLRGLTAMGRYAQWLIDGTRAYRQMPIEDRRGVLMKAEPDEPWAHAREALDLAEVNRCPEAREKLVFAENLAPDNARMLRFVGAVYWWCGEQGRARQLVDSMKRRTDAGDHGYRIAQLHMLFEEKDSAFVWLGRHQWTMAELAGLRASHYLDPLRSDRRYVELLQRLGIQSPD